MTSIAQPLWGVHLLQPHATADVRGDFVKTFHREQFAALGIEFFPVEEFYSVSRVGVIRGMHFQLPPFEQAKLVYCARGRVLDVLLDLRRNSPTYKQVASAELSAANRLQFYIPPGIAHGFLSLEDHTLMIYKTSTVHAPTHDTGIRWDSFGFQWGVSQPTISARDAELPAYDAFVSPF